MAFSDSDKISSSDIVNYGVQHMQDIPSGSAEDIKKMFDKFTTDILMPKFNALIEKLADKTANIDGASKIGFQGFGDGSSADDVKTALLYLKSIIREQGSTEIGTGAVTSEKIDTGAVTTIKIADNAVETAKIKNSSVTSNKINDNAITSSKLANSAVETAKIADDAITNSKIANDAVETAQIKDAVITLAKLASGVVADSTLTGMSKTASYTEPTSNMDVKTAIGNIVKCLDTLNSHLANTSNPHNVTAAQIGLGNTDLLNKIYPVGSIYISTSSANPSTFIGGTWEQYSQGRVIIGVGNGNDGTDSNTYAVGNTGGKYRHILTVNQLASHNHTISSHNHTLGPSGYEQTVIASHNTVGYKISTTSETSPFQKYLAHVLSNMQTGSTSQTIGNIGADEPHNNIQPYIACYIWHRTA